MTTQKDPFLEKWLQEFKSNNTRRVYSAGIKKFKEAIGIKNLSKYVKEPHDVASDFRKYLVSLEGKPSKTIATYSASVKVFLQDNGKKIEDNSWKKIRRRGYMPKRIKPQTQDKRPTKLQLKRILNYVDIKGKALILFLASSGTRIGETLKLLEEDFNLQGEPPSVHIRAEYTKGGVGERTVYFSYEARDAIIDWLRIKDTMGKRDGTTYKDEKVFPFSHKTAVVLWDRACDKAGLGIKDKRTKRRIYHLHSLRKFFRTKIGLDQDTTHSLLGHVAYLDESYLRQEQTEIAKAYLEAMPNVSVFEMQNEDVKDLEIRNTELEAKMKALELKLNFMATQLGTLLNGRT